MIVSEDTVSAKDLSNVIMVNHIHGIEETSLSKKKWNGKRIGREEKLNDWILRYDENS